MFLYSGVKEICYVKINIVFQLIFNLKSIVFCCETQRFMLEKQMSYKSPTKPPPWGGFCFSVVRVVFSK